MVSTECVGFLCHCKTEELLVELAYLRDCLYHSKVPGLEEKSDSKAGTRQVQDAYVRKDIETSLNSVPLAKSGTILSLQ